jgi:hypothetical protein
MGGKAEDLLSAWRIHRHLLLVNDTKYGNVFRIFLLQLTAVLKYLRAMGGE